MRNILLSLTLLFLADFSGVSQTKNPGDTLNAVLNEKISVTGIDGSQRYIRFPEKGYYVLVYRFKGTDPRKVETIDSVRLLEKKIVDIMLGGMLGDLKVICLSYGSKEDFALWSASLKKEKLFKESSKYTVDYFHTNGDPATLARCMSLFTKVNLFGPDGRIISLASTISRFRWHLRDEKIEVKGKIVTKDNGIDEPLEEVDVHIENHKSDTLAKGKTDKYGDFAMKIPNNDTLYTLKASPRNKKVKSIVLLTQEGKKVSDLRQNFRTFEYKLMKADILELAEMKVDEDIDISFKKFEKSRDKELVVIEDIIYEKDKFAVTRDAEEILKKVIDNMKNNSDTKLEIYSHTDSQGDDASNMALSSKRANAVADYLEANGIARTRIKAGGKGETVIRNRCGNGVNCSDKEHSYNRRTEFKFYK